MEKIIEHLDILRNSASETVQYLSGKEIKKIPFFCMGMLKRVEDTTVAGRLLFGQFRDDPEGLPKYDFAIGILFRSVLLDTLIGLNMLNEIHKLEAAGKNAEETEVALNDFCDVYLADGLKQMLSYIEDAERYFKKMPAETADTFNTIAVTFKPFFEPYPNDGSKPILKNKQTIIAKGLFETLAKTQDLNNVSKLYDSYAYLSKYDHFGLLYYHTISEPVETKLSIYLNIVEAFVAHNALLHVVLAKHSDNDEFLNDQKDKANEHLLQQIHANIKAGTAK
jgi:hypothetical protein